jgi:transposase-like protein
METVSKQARSQKGQNIMNLTEDEARQYIEKLLWPDGNPICPKCRSTNAYRMTGKTCRPGLCRCRDCKKQFTVTVGTIFEDSHLPMALWVRAIHLMTSSKKGISALQLMRNLGLGSYKTAWHLAHRIRLAMKCEPMPKLLNGQIQADETLIGGKIKIWGRREPHKFNENKSIVMTMVETNGRAKTLPIESVTTKNLRTALVESCDLSSQIITDERNAYPAATGVFEGGHETVNHSQDEYVRKVTDEQGNQKTITTNTAEAYFALLKRGIHGTFHHVSKQHLHRYCNEFDFRWNRRMNTDIERRDDAVRGAEGKRLLFKTPMGN